MRAAFLICVIFIIGISTIHDAKGQHHSLFNNLKSNIKHAERHYKNGSYLSAIHSFKKVLYKDSANIVAKLRMADCYRNLNNSKESEHWYRSVIQSSIIKPIDLLHFAQSLMANGKYEESKMWFEKYNSEHTSDSLSLRKIEGIIKMDLFFSDSLKFPVHEININSPFSDFSPAYYDKGIVFVSSRSENAYIKRFSSRDHSAFYDLYYSSCNPDGSFAPPVKFHKKINDKLHEGPLVFFDHENKMIFTKNEHTKMRSHGKQPVNKLMLFEARKDSTSGWNNVQPLTFNSSKYSIGHPAINKDGSVLYFISDKAGGYGGTDIYKSEFKNSSWSPPVNLGPEINTSGNELFPTIHLDSFLYFSSNGYGGLGGLDIYRAKIKNGKYINIKNIGYPINSTQDDFGIIFNEDRKSGLFSSNRKNGGYDDDIYSFEIVSVLVNGLVCGKLKKNPLDQVMLKLYLNNTEVSNQINNSEGKFYLNLDPGKEYLLVSTKKDYKVLKTKISTKEYSKGKPMRIVLELEKVNKGYANGIVKVDSFTNVPHAKIYIQEKNSETIDTISADENGEFNYEIDLDDEYIFFALKEKKYGTISLKNTKKKKGSVLFYLNIKMQDFTEKNIKGIITYKGAYAEGETIVIQEQQTGKTETMCSNKNGEFSFQAASYGIYNIKVTCKQKIAYIKSYSIKNKRSPLLELNFE